MPYINTETVSERRKLIKKEFPKFKFSIKTENYSTIDISVLSGPIKYTPPYTGYSVNPYSITDHFKNEPEMRDLLLRLYEIANEGNGTEVMDGDYGRVPDFYVRIHIGRWDKPYEVK